MIKSLRYELPMSFIPYSQIMCKKYIKLPESLITIIIRIQALLCNKELAHLCKEKNMLHACMWINIQRSLQYQKHPYLRIYRLYRWKQETNTTCTANCFGWSSFSLESFFGSRLLKSSSSSSSSSRPYLEKCFTWNKDHSIIYIP